MFVRLLSGLESSFIEHFSRILSGDEISNLLKRKVQFKWEMPAVGRRLSKWVGTGENPLEMGDGDSHDGLELKLYLHWLDVYKSSGGIDFSSSQERQFFSLCNSYHDILHCDKKPFYFKGREDSSITDAYVMHALNHIFRTQKLVRKNDAKLAMHPESGQEEIINGGAYLDQGFTRPKVLILLPLRRIALRVVKRLVGLTPSTCKANVDQMERFLYEFGKEEDLDGNDDLDPKKTQKPVDYEVLFGGNSDDHFMIGIKITRRSIKLFSDFYGSDMILASPLALITKMGEMKVEKDKDVDYLSSVEVLIIDHADVLAMQNWSHVDMLMEQLNCIPCRQHGTDIMRIRPWYLDGHAKFYRQTILLSYFLSPEMNALFNNQCLNYEGKIKFICGYRGVIPKMQTHGRQIYEKFNAASVTVADDARFSFFTEKVFPKMKDSAQGGIMVFISSFFEFVRLRNFLKSQGVSFCSFMDHTSASDISRARTAFFHGKRNIMLYTERAHFYHRYKIRGVKNLIIYSLPQRKEIFIEITNMLEEPSNLSCTVIFSQFDKFRLERIVGTVAAERMLSSTKDMFIFC